MASFAFLTVMCGVSDSIPCGIDFTFDILSVLLSRIKEPNYTLVKMSGGVVCIRRFNKLQLLRNQ
jgi:hypothetical protein